MVEAAYYQLVLGAVYLGRWWLDGRTGYFGLEGNPVPVGNMVAAIRASQHGREGEDHFWSNATARGNYDHHCCGHVHVDGADVMTGNCN